MARDSAGVYTLPSGYLAATGETILASQHNSPLEDIRDALTNSLPRNGAAPMTAALKMGANKITGLADGTAATDAAAFGQLGYLKHIPEVIKTDDYTITTAEAGKAVIANKATAITFTLPAVSSADEPYLIRNIGAGDLTVDGNSSEQIEGANSITFKTGQAALVWANGTAWRAFRSGTTYASTDNAVPRANGTGGELQDSGVLIDDDDQINQSSATGANVLPQGTTAQRPGTPAAGMFRYNSSKGTTEFYGPSGWLPNSVIQTVYDDNTTSTQVSNSIPFDGSIPQNTEGAEILSASITPQVATSAIRARVVVYFVPDTGNPIATAALFRSGTANALSTSAVIGEGGNLPSAIVMDYQHVPGTASEITYTVRVGPHSTDDIWVNGETAQSSTFGGTTRSTLILEEIAQ